MFDQLSSISAPQIGAATDFSRFSAMRAEARRDPNQSFTAVAKEFEALFIQLMLKASREATNESGLFNSRELKIFREMLDQQVALAMAEQGGLGFETVLRSQLGLSSEQPHAGSLKLPERVDFPPRVAPAATPLPPVTAAPKPATQTARAADAAATRHEFVATLRPLAASAAAELGLDADVLLAQAALETGWGKHVIRHPDGRSSNNWFGIKAHSSWPGGRIDVPTLEYIDGQARRVNATFRAYPDSAAAFDDYVAFLKTQARYATALAHDGDVEKFAYALQHAGYATDPRYAQKILSIKAQLSDVPTLTARR